MIKIKPWLFLSLFIFSYLAQPLAATANSTLGACIAKQDSSLVHINGVNTTEEGAQANVDSIRATIKPNTLSAIQYLVAYNPSNGVFRDLWDVANQKALEFSEVSVDEIREGYFSGTAPERLSVEKKENFSKAITEFESKRIAEKGPIEYEDADLAQITGFLKSASTESNKLLLVPHSQGNLYANSAYNLVTSGPSPIPKESISIMGIATAAGFVAGQGTYVTADVDIVIKLLSVLRPTLKSNTPISFSFSDITGHNLIKTYLDPNRKASEKIKDAILASLDNLKAPSNQVSNQGPITVTMTWGSQPDVDLHVYEPNGDHVYYETPQGTVGLLDIDDTDSFGPEHYFSSCEKLLVGKYTIGVNYFEGTSPEKVLITIKTPSSIKTYSTTLSRALGEDGDNRPITVATVEVIKDSTGKLDYKIDPD